MNALGRWRGCFLALPRRGRLLRLVRGGGRPCAALVTASHCPVLLEQLRLPDAFPRVRVGHVGEPRLAAFEPLFDRPPFQLRLPLRPDPHGRHPAAAWRAPGPGVRGRCLFPCELSLRLSPFLARRPLVVGLAQCVLAGGVRGCKSPSSASRIVGSSSPATPPWVWHPRSMARLPRARRRHRSGGRHPVGPLISLSAPARVPLRAPAPPSRSAFARSAGCAPLRPRTGGVCA